MMRRSTSLTACCIILLSVLSVLWASPRDTIPPETLAEFDEDVLSGDRPTTVVMKQADIFGLRATPVFDVDFVRLGFDSDQLSKVQRDIFDEWLAGGHNKLLLKGRDREKYAGLLGTASIDDWGRDGSRGIRIDSGARASVDVAAATSARDWSRSVGSSGNYRSEYHFCGINESASQGIVVVARYGDNNAAMGMFVADKTHVYFLPSSLGGPDADRLRLNFWHWALGLQVPGAANTTVAGANATTPGNLAEQAQYDILSLRNGDAVSGVVVNDALTVRASYGTVTFPLEQIAKVLIEGDGDNVDAIILTNGDKISGVIQEEEFAIELTNGETINIAKDKIRSIVIQAERGE